MFYNDTKKRAIVTRMKPDTSIDFEGAAIELKKELER